MSPLGACWAHAYFEKEVCFGRMPILRRKSVLGTCLFLEKDLFWGKTYFWKGRPNFGAHTTGGKKETRRKRRKNNMQEEKQRGAQVDKLDHDKVRVFDKYCNDYNPIK
jgi:hypothetical protein